MTNSQGVAEKALVTGFDTVTNVQHTAAQVALEISDLYRLKPLVFWGIVGSAVAATALVIAIARR